VNRVEPVHIEKLPTGVPGLDEVLGGGLPELSFNLIAGGPGCGKTTLAHQMMFANASPERPALYITVVGEPPLKMLRYQQQYAFFDLDRVHQCIRFLHLGDALIDTGLEGVLEAIVGEVERSRPRLVVVDSFRSVLRTAQSAGEVDVEHFVQRLALHLTSWEATTFLVGEYVDHDDSNPLFSVADGILWMYQDVVRSSVMRKLQVVKMRGQGQIAGRHAMTIGDHGVRVFPRQPAKAAPRGAPSTERTSIGVPAIDAMLGGGVLVGTSTLVAGPSGTGKSTIAGEFAVAGARGSEPAVIAIIERSPGDYLRTHVCGSTIEELVAADRLRIVFVRPVDLSVDEMLASVQAAVEEIGARRVVIDSLTGLELALAAAARDDLHDALYRLVGALTRLGVTVVMTAEADTGDTAPVAPRGVSLLIDNLLLLRYHQAEGVLRRSLTVLKMRGSSHSDEVRYLEVDGGGVQIGARFGATTGRAEGAR